MGMSMVFQTSSSPRRLGIASRPPVTMAGCSAPVVFASGCMTPECTMSRARLCPVPSDRWIPRSCTPCVGLKTYKSRATAGSVRHAAKVACSRLSLLAADPFTVVTLGPIARAGYSIFGFDIVGFGAGVFIVVNFAIGFQFRVEGCDFSHCGFPFELEISD